MSESIAVTIQHELTADDDLELRCAIHRANRLRVPAIGFGVLCIGIGVVTGVQAGLEYGAASALFTVAPWTLLGAIWLVFGLVPFAAWARDARVLGKHERSLDETGFHLRAGTVAVDLPWHAMRSTVETAGFFLFFDGQDRPHYLPKRGMRERELRDAQRLFAARAPEAVRRLGP